MSRRRGYPVIVQHSLLAMFIVGIFRTIGRTLRLGWRFFTGSMLDGIPRTDYGVLAKGTTALVKGRIGRWGYLPRASRAGIRAAVLLGTPVLIWAWMTHRGALVFLAVTVPAGIAWKRHRKAVRTGETRRFRRTYVQPLAMAAGPILGLPADAPDKWLKVDPEIGNLTAALQGQMTPAEIKAREFYGTRIEPVLRYIPERVQRARWWATETAPWIVSVRTAFTRPTEEHPPAVEIRAGAWVPTDTRAELRQMVSQKLGLGGLEEHWNSVGPQTVARWIMKVMPPEKVTLEDIVTVIDALEEHEFVIGLQAGRAPYMISVDDDSPHIACSAGSGAGKSVFAMLIAVQILRRGGQVIILDLKGSHRWARGLEGVIYCRKPSEMHKVLIEVNTIAAARNEQAFEEEDGWDPGPRILVIFEEMNSTVAQLKAYWEKNREKGEPKTSPAVTAFRELMYMGRAAKVNLFGVAQMLTANTTGGPESRECFGVRALARFTRNSWKMLVPECAMPRPLRIRGRWQIAVAGEVTSVQVAFLTTAEARALAAQPIPAPREPITAETSAPADVPVSPDSPPVAPGQARPVSVSQDTPRAETGPQGEPADPLEELVTLREAVEQGIVEGTEQATKKRMQRDREKGENAPDVRGKRGNANLYRVRDLVEWSMVLK
jgi:hypothetical protein